MNEESNTLRNVDAEVLDTCPDTHGILNLRSISCLCCYSTNDDLSLGALAGILSFISI